MIHKDIIDQLKREIDSISPQTIYMGYYTDPYQPCEAEQLQTRKVLEFLSGKGFSVNILTKSDLVTRDIDLLQRMKNASISVSVAFNDNGIREKFEPNTKDTEVRIDALRKLREAGIKTSALICPVIPHITDAMPLVDQLATLTDTIWIYGLSIETRSDQNWQNLEIILDEYFPDLRKPIEDIVFTKDHQFWTRLRQELEDIQKNRGLTLNIHV
jgi:DNA repair photolyase